MDIHDLLQSTDADDLDRTVYNSKIKHPQNGFYDTPAFKRIRSKGLAPVTRDRARSAFKHKKTCQKKSSATKSAPAQHPKGRRKCGGKGKIPPLGQKGKRGTTQTHRVKR